ncbi:MAG: circadian clock protein KaiB [Pedobacter sp.]|nr:MAG: circadian clock protein KaiB [Pedobacter sp.]
MKESTDPDRSDLQQNNDGVVYTLSLYVTGASPNSVKAIANVKRICDEYLAGIYELEIIDIYKQPKIASREQVIAIPMLIKRSPEPFKRLIGDMSDTDKVLKGLGLTRKSK